ncbi:MAG: inositol monophosphatase [Desulfohalobiaceae bacterium]|nr:inositol monophosphatase [Desulfohalobiaceae bacterium]
MGFSPQDLLPHVESAVGKSGEIILDHWSRAKTIRLKGRVDLVTETDVAVEKDLGARLGAILPEAGFLAEETASGGDLEGTTWIVDPLDGTTNFAHGLPFVAVSVALWSEGEVVLGVIHLPRLGETFSAVKGGGARLNNQSIGVSATEDPESSLVATGFPYDIHTRAEEEVQRLKRVLVQTRGIRRMGAAAVDLAYTACGCFEAYYEVGLKPWDTAAGWLLTREAGGRVTTFEGDPFHPFADSILASNGRIHSNISNLLTASFQ